MLVGVIVTKEDVIKAVGAYTETVKDRLVKDRYKFFGMFFGGAKAIPSLKWANGGDIKEAVDAKMLEVLGPKDERDVIVKKVCCLGLLGDRKLVPRVDGTRSQGNTFGRIKDTGRREPKRRILCP